MTLIPGFIKNNKQTILLWLLALSTLAILVGTLFPANYSLPEKAWDYDKLGHVVMFVVWTFLLGLIQVVRNKSNLWIIFLGGSAFGLVIEILQLILPTNRSAELFDFLADTLGAGLAVLLLYYVRKKLKRYLSPDNSAQAQTTA